MSSPRSSSARTDRAAAASRQPLDVTTLQGVARGIREHGVETWRGLPYAAPPVGEARFRAPRQPRPWSGVRDAARFGPVAPQSREGNFIGAAKNTPMGEDCLTLNVVRPVGAGAAGHPESLLPVMVFIHGGAYSVGSSAEVPRNGDTLVRQGNVVYVSINYRLGALGFLDFTEFSTPERPIENNLGLKDCVAALEWVAANIRAFGGDPDRVTLFGESAGANAVTTLMTVPRASGLFARAIAQSSPTNAVYPPGQTRLWAEQFVELLSARVANDSVENTSAEDAGELLVGADWRELVRATDALQRHAPDTDPGTIALCPAIDGDFLPERPLDAFKGGRAHRVPLIIGTNDREGALFSGRLDILATTPKRIRAIFSKTKKKARKAIKAEYPGLPARRPAADFGGDYAFWYPTVKVAERHARFAPVYFYRFDIAPRLVHLAGFDATHGLELFALFDRMGGAFGRTMTLLGGRRAFLAAGTRMREYWVRFAYAPAAAAAPAPAPSPALAVAAEPAAPSPALAVAAEPAATPAPAVAASTAGTAVFVPPAAAPSDNTAAPAPLATVPSPAGVAPPLATSRTAAADTTAAPAPLATASRGIAKDVIEWPLYDAESRQTLIIDTVDRIERDPRSSRRIAWQAFVPHV